MNFSVTLLALGLVLLVCAIFSKVLYKYGVPVLIVFLGLGLLIGLVTDNYLFRDSMELAQQICTLALVFIIFSGGFGTKWKTARHIVRRSIWLSTLGVAITAGIVGLFAYLVFPQFGILQCLLLGAIIGSTDSASVFAILRSKNLNLKGTLAPTLEVESGSNDPMAYMLTVILLQLVPTPGGQIISSPLLLLIKDAIPLGAFVPVLFLFQIVVGGAVGLGLSLLIAKLLKSIKFDIEGMYPIIIIGVVILIYGVSDFFGGNGLLAVYVAGLILGNTEALPQKRPLVRFFDGISWLAQILLFVTLGLLANFFALQHVAWQSVVLAIVITLIARPAAVMGILFPHKVPFKEQLFISWVGFRGASSIVFAILPLIVGVPNATEIFHVVFFMAIFSVALQGTLMPTFARKLGLVERGSSMLATFTDYPDETYDMLVELVCDKDCHMSGRTIAELGIPTNVFIVLIKRKGKTIAPKGSTEILEGDKLLFSGESADALVAVKSKYALVVAEEKPDKRRAAAGKKSAVPAPPSNKEILHIEIVQHPNLLNPDIPATPTPAESAAESAAEEAFVSDTAADAESGLTSPAVPEENQGAVEAAAVADVKAK